MVAEPIPGRLFDRALRESLEAGLSIEKANAVIAEALMRASLPDVPEDLDLFARFVRGALTSALLAMTGPATTEACIERISHVLWLASSTIRHVAPTEAELRRTLEIEPDAREEPSGMRSVESPPPGWSNQAVPAARISAPEAPRAPRHAPTLGRMKPVPAPARAPGVVEIPAPRPMGPPVLVLSLDPTLRMDAAAQLEGARPTIAIMTQAELVRTINAAYTSGFSVLVDASLPSVDLATFVGLAALLPTGTRVVLWGTDERQKTRLARVFPIASGWTAAGSTPLRELFPHE
ncbi:MAG: hypothetical protein U0234_33385 [Sandaracinus sp.]